MAIYSDPGQKSNARHMNERVVAYIDGFNLYFGLKAARWKRFYWLNVQALVRNLLKGKQDLVFTKYFTSRVSYPPDKERRQSVYIEALETLSDFRIHYGHYQANPQRCRECGTKTMVPSEKMTDVNIAVELLSDAYQDRFDVALLISADSDLTAPLLTIKNLFPEKRIIVAFPPQRHSAQLERNAHGSLQIGRASLAKSVFPDSVPKAGGFILKKPSEWYQVEPASVPGSGIRPAGPPTSAKESRRRIRPAASVNRQAGKHPRRHPEKAIRRAGPPQSQNRHAGGRKGRDTVGELPHNIVFNRKENVPDDKALKRVLGQAYSLYEEILRLTGTVPREWKFYGTTYGWQLKPVQKGKALFYLVPLEKSFRVGFAVREKERDVLLKAKLPPKAKEDLRKAKKYSEGYPLRLSVTRTADLKPARLIIETLLSMRS
jgi:uncharacterized LabA/DUF88 family protein